MEPYGTDTSTVEPQLYGAYRIGTSTVEPQLYGPYGTSISLYNLYVLSILYSINVPSFGVCN